MNLVILAALGLALALPPADADAIPIRGRVADGDGFPRAGVTVELPVLGPYESGLVDDDPPPVAGARTGADGFFVVHAPAAGSPAESSAWIPSGPVRDGRATIDGLLVPGRLLPSTVAVSGPAVVAAPAVAADAAHRGLAVR